MEEEGVVSVEIGRGNGKWGKRVVSSQGVTVRR